MAVVFAILDHDPHPQESMEYTIYMTNKPASTNLADWSLAQLDSVYLEGWEADTVATADAFTSVWKISGGATFRYVSFRAMGSQAFGSSTGTSAGGNDAEIDAIAGLTASYLAVPEPSSVLLVFAGFAALATTLRRS